MKKLLLLDFLPRSVDLGLLALRLWFGLAMLLLHGWTKLMNFSAMVEQFTDILGIGKPATVVLAIFGEVVCTALLVLGLFTRFAALAAGITMFVAFWIAHGHKLSGEGSGELAFAYLGVFVVLFIAGPGKFSVDAKIGAKV